MYPNQIYTAFSFIGFVLAIIPFYWHLEGTWTYSLDSSNSSKNVRCSLEYGHLHVHDLDSYWMSHAMCQLDRVEWEHDQQGSGLL